MFTSRPGFESEREQRFVEALLAMSYENPVHRPILESEGLRRWLTPHLDGYSDLRQAAAQQGFFQDRVAMSA
jgi:ABC-type phosphate/phosphonate transport system substrate-binding protein